MFSKRRVLVCLHVPVFCRFPLDRHTKGLIGSQPARWRSGPANAATRRPPPAPSRAPPARAGARLRSRARQPPADQTQHITSAISALARGQIPPSAGPQAGKSARPDLDLVRFGGRVVGLGVTAGLSARRTRFEKSRGSPRTGTCPRDGPASGHVQYIIWTRPVKNPDTASTKSGQD